MARPLQQLGTLSGLGKATLAAALFAATGLGAAAGVLTTVPQRAEAQPQVQAAPARNDAAGRREGRKDKDALEATADHDHAAAMPAAATSDVAAKKRPRPKDRGDDRRPGAAKTAPRQRNAAARGASATDDSSSQETPAEAPAPADAPDDGADGDPPAETPPADETVAEEPADDDTSSEGETTEGEGGDGDGGDTDEGSSAPDAPPAPAES